VSVQDNTKKYAVTSRIIFDLSFFFSFFGNPDFTKENIQQKVLSICEKWNMKYAGKPEVKKLSYF
jgi:hypothetical protein